MAIGLIRNELPDEKIPMPLLPAILDEVVTLKVNQQLLMETALAAGMMERTLSALYETKVGTKIQNVWFAHSEQAILGVTSVFESYSKDHPDSQLFLSPYAILGVELGQMADHRFPPNPEGESQIPPLSTRDVFESAARCCEYLFWGTFYEKQFEAIFEQKQNREYQKCAILVNARFGLAGTKLLLTTLALCELALSSPLHPAFHSLRHEPPTFSDSHPGARFLTALQYAKDITPPQKYSEYEVYQREVCRSLNWALPSSFHLLSDKWQSVELDFYRKWVKECLNKRKDAPDNFILFPTKLFESPDKAKVDIHLREFFGPTGTFNYPPIPVVMHGDGTVSMSSQEMHYFTSNWILAHFGSQIWFKSEISPPDLGPLTPPDKLLDGLLHSYFGVDRTSLEGA